MPRCRPDGETGRGKPSAPLVARKGDPPRRGGNPPGADLRGKRSGRSALRPRTLRCHLSLSPLSHPATRPDRRSDPGDVREGLAPPQDVPGAGIAAKLALPDRPPAVSEPLAAPVGRDRLG